MCKVSQRWSNIWTGGIDLQSWMSFWRQSWGEDPFIPRCTLQCSVIDSIATISIFHNSSVSNWHFNSPTSAKSTDIAGSIPCEADCSEMKAACVRLMIRSVWSWLTPRVQVWRRRWHFPGCFQACVLVKLLGAIYTVIFSCLFVHQTKLNFWWFSKFTPDNHC